MLKVNLNESNSIVVLEPQGQLTQADFLNASRIIDPYIQKNGILKGIIIYVKDFPGWDSFSSLVSHLKFIHEHHKLVSHIAFVTDSIIGEFAENVASHFVKAKIESFDFDEFDEAKHWILDDEYTTHGLFFSCETTNNNIFIKFKAIGTLTHEDYERITPIIDDALETIAKPNVNILVDISRLEGWELKAAWDDLKLGIKHGKELNKVAIYGHNKWQDFAASLGTWFISGEAKSFDDLEEAIAWLGEKYNSNYS